MNRILKNWDLTRIVRLVLSVIVAVYAITSKEYSFFILSGLLLFQAILNVSCCGSQGCSTNSKSKPKDNVYGDQIKEYKPD